MIPTIGLTIGEPAGIGPEVIEKALASGKLPPAHYLVIGSAAGIRPGQLSLRSATVALGALTCAAEMWKAGEIDAVVTAPVQKENLARIGFAYPGQTEFFAQHCGMTAEQAVMMLTDKKLTVSLLSTHCSLREAIRQITPEKVRQVVRETVRHLQLLRSKKPCVAVAGLNPHAGENGLFGDEEERVLAPAIRELQQEGHDVSGPHSPDTIFHRAARGEYDAVVCCYHDQGLIPFKLLAFSTGVNITLGLPMIRTSPDHGTALDLAGKNQADPRSMIAAIRLAHRLAQKIGHV